MSGTGRSSRVPPSSMFRFTSIPRDPHPAVIKAYYGEYAKTHPMFIRAAWGLTFEAGTQAMRLVLSGLFDALSEPSAHPRPSGRDHSLYTGEDRRGAVSRYTDEELPRGIFVPFSRHDERLFSDPALQCCIQEIGIDRVMFSVDWPFASNGKGTHWLKNTPLSDTDRQKLAAANAKRLSETVRKVRDTWLRFYLQQLH